VPWSELALNGLALLLYPGLLACVLLGLAAELVTARTLGSTPSIPTRLWPAVRGGGLPPLAAAAALLTLLAASQVALPFNPVPASERNLLVAAVSLIGASWLVWAWGWNRPRLDSRLVLAAQACWLAALLSPALVSQSLRPQVLGAVLVVQELPLKVLAALVFLLCLPVLLQLVPEAAPQGPPGARQPGDLEGSGFVAVRMLLWLPLCGLFVSLFLPPAADDAFGFLRSAGATLAVAAFGVLAAAALSRWGLLPVRSLYLRIAAPLALVMVLLAALSAAYPQAL
jgi:hypothetical protein